MRTLRQWSAAAIICLWTAVGIASSALGFPSSGMMLVGSSMQGPPPAPTIIGVQLSSNGFTCGAAGTVGAITVQGVNNTAATLSLTGTDAAQFSLSSAIVPSNLTVGASPGGCPRTYNLNIVATLSGATGSPFTQAETIIGSSSSGVTFTALHTYFVATNGNDACNGTTTTIASSGNCAWQTANHPVVCGDVIIAAPGTYNTGANAMQFGTVGGTCPSTSGGRADSPGGIWAAVLLCGGTDLEACVFKLPGSAGGGDNVNLGNSYWAVEGFKCDGVTNINYCFMTDSGANNRIIHHEIFINNVAVNAAQGFATNGCPGGCTHNIPGEGSDYVAMIGNIAFNSSQANCVGAFDIVAPGVFDQLAGTHNIMYGNFSYRNLGTCNSDGTGLYFDTWDAHGAAYQGVMANNITWNNERYGYGLTHSGDHLTAVSNLLYHNNTAWANCQGVYNEFFCGSFAYNGTFSVTIPYTGVEQNNIALETLSTQGTTGTGPVYAMALSGVIPGITIGGTGKENIFEAVRNGCTAAQCAPGPVASGSNCSPTPCAAAENDGNTLGTNIYVNPAYRNTADLAANRIGTPSCAGFTNVTACMGWNATTQTLMIPSGATCPAGFTCSTVGASGVPMIYDLMPTCAQCTGKGYQLPSTTCAANAEYPAYLKGLVYLRPSGFVNGATITEMNDLVTKPCGM